MSGIAHRSKDCPDWLHGGVQTVALKKTPQALRRDKPLRIPLPHSLYDFEGAEVCLLVKDHKGGQGCQTWLQR